MWQSFHNVFQCGWINVWLWQVWSISLCHWEIFNTFVPCTTRPPVCCKRPVGLSIFLHGLMAGCWFPSAQKNHSSGSSSVSDLLIPFVYLCWALCERSVGQRGLAMPCRLPLHGREILREVQPLPLGAQRKSRHAMLPWGGWELLNTTFDSYLKIELTILKLFLPI